jgi:hypothetical protein
MFNKVLLLFVLLEQREKRNTGEIRASYTAEVDRLYQKRKLLLGNSAVCLVVAY